MEDDIPTDEDQHLKDLNIESDDDDDIDPNLGNEGLGPDMDNNMDEE